jgi:hypothetical protein
VCGGCWVERSKEGTLAKKEGRQSRNGKKGASAGKLRCSEAGCLFSVFSFLKEEKEDKKRQWGEDDGGVTGVNFVFDPHKKGKPTKESKGGGRKLLEISPSSRPNLYTDGARES